MKILHKLRAEPLLKGFSPIFILDDSIKISSQTQLFELKTELIINN